MLWTELGVLVTVPGLLASKSQPQATHTLWGMDTQNFQAMGQLISSTGLAGQVYYLPSKLGHPAITPSPTQ